MGIVNEEDFIDQSFIKDIQIPLQWKPSTMEVIGSSIRMHNTLFGIRDRVMMPTDDPVKGYDPLLHEKVQTDPSLAPYVINSRSDYETNLLINEARDQQRDTLILDQASTGQQLFGGLIAGSTDPVNYLFGGSVLKTANFFKNIGTGAKRGIQAGLASELPLQLVQPDRTAEESFFITLSSGGFGAASYGLFSLGRFNNRVSSDDLNAMNQNFKDTLEAVYVGNNEYKVYDFNRTIPGFPKAPHEKRFMDPIGYDPKKKRSRSQDPQRIKVKRPIMAGRDAKTIGYVDRTVKLFNPGARLRNSPFDTTSATAEKLIESPGLRQKNLMDIRSEPSVETLSKAHMGALAELLGRIDNTWLGYRNTLSGRDDKLSILTIQDALKLYPNKNGEQHLNIREFRREVTFALDNNNQHPIKEVAEAATSIRKFFDTYADLSIAAKLIDPEDVVKNYVPQMWDIEAVLKNKDRFRVMVYKNMTERNPKLLGDPEFPIKLNSNIDALVSSGRSIAGFDSTGPRGIFKKRFFDVDRSKFEDYLVNDIDTILRQYMRIMSSDLELQRKFGSVTLDKQLADLQKEANKKIANAKSAKVKEQLAKDLEYDTEALKAMRDIVRGIYGIPDDPYSFSSKAVRTAMDLNNTIALGGATVSSIADVGRAFMTLGAEDVFKGIKVALTNPGKFGISKKDATIFGTGLDMKLNTTAQALTGMQDLPQRFSKLERGLSYMTNATFLLNMLSPWNAFMKQTIGAVTQHHMIDNAIKWRASGPKAGEVPLKEQEGVYFSGTGPGILQFANKGKGIDYEAAFHEGVYLTKIPQIAKRYGKNVKAFEINTKKTYKLTTDEDILELFKKAGIKNPKFHLTEPWLQYYKKLKEDLIKKHGKKKGMKIYNDDNKYPNRPEVVNPLDFQKIQGQAFRKARTWLINNGYDSVEIEFAKEIYNYRTGPFGEGRMTEFTPESFKNGEVINKTPQGEMLYGAPMEQTIRKTFSNNQMIVFDQSLVKEIKTQAKEKITKSGKLKMTSSFLNEKDAIMMADLFDEFGETIDGFHIPNTTTWKPTEKNGLSQSTIDDLLTRYRAGIVKEIDSTIVTPGAGDAPLWTHKGIGKLIGQYKSFSFAAASRVMVPGLQYKDANQLFGALMMIWLGATVSSMKEQLRGINREKPLTEHITDGIDQSGILGWYFHANNMIEAISDNRIGFRPFTDQAPPYGTTTAWKLGQIAPVLSTGTRFAGVVGDVLKGDADYQTRVDFYKSMPGNTLFYLQMGEMLRQRKNWERVSEFEDLE